MAPHSSTFAWKIPWMEKPGGLQSVGSLESDTTEWLPFLFSLSCIGAGNSNPLQCSCLENPGDGEAWWAAVYGVAQSRTRLKRLRSSSSSIYTIAFPLRLHLSWVPRVLICWVNYFFPWCTLSSEEREGLSYLLYLQHLLHCLVKSNTQ